MKLDKKYLKNLINEVLDEATRRDFLKGAAGLMGTAALGGTIADLNVGEAERIADMTEEDKMKLLKLGSTIPVSSAESKKALDKLRIVPNLEFYSVAPAIDDVTKVKYAYVSQPMIDDYYGDDPSLMMDMEDVKYFYDGWTSTQVYKYVFGQLAFWGTYRNDDDPMSRQMAPNISNTDVYGNEIKIPLLPLAWTASMDVFFEKFLQLEQNLTQYPDMKEYILLKEGLTPQRYLEMKKNYEGLLVATASTALIDNPNYEKEEK